MRDYPNGGFFFIDVTEIQPVGTDGFEIEGIYDDMKRAVLSGKLIILTNFKYSTATCNVICQSEYSETSSGSNPVIARFVNPFTSEQWTLGATTANKNLVLLKPVS